MPNTDFYKTLTTAIWKPMSVSVSFTTEKPSRGRLDDVDKYLINDKAVVIMFKDGTKTVATVDKEDTFDAELGFCLAMFKYMVKKTNTSKSSYKRELECIKEDKFKDYLFENFDRVTFKNVEKSRKFLKSLKPTGKKWSKVR